MRPPLEFIEQEIMRLAELPFGWNGYNAKRIDPEIATVVDCVLEELFGDNFARPSVVPLVDGGVQVEWHKNGIDLEIEFRPDEDSEFYVLDDQIEDEGPVQTDRELLRDTMKRLME